MTKELVSTFVEQCGEALRLQEKAVPQALARGAEVDLDVISERRLIVLTGCGDSYAVAEYGTWFLLQEGFNAVAVSAPDTQRIRLDEKCLVVGITASGRSLTTISALDYAAHNGASTVALTDNRQGEITNVAETIWLTKSGVKTYNIIPTAPTTAAMAFLLGIMGQTEPEKYEKDIELLQGKMTSIYREAEREGKLMSELISIGHKAYFISQGPNFVAALLGMMKINETSLIQGIAIPREEFRHYGSLSTHSGDLAVFISDAPTTEKDVAFVRILWEKLGLKSYHLHTSERLKMWSPLAQAIVNTISLQSAVYYALRRFAPEKKWFRLPHAKAFRIY